MPNPSPARPTAASDKQSTTKSQGGQKDAEALLRADHRKVDGLFKEFEDAAEAPRKQELARRICQELIIHSLIEERVFYPACRAKDVEDDLLDEAQVEHDSVKFLVRDLLGCAPESEFYDAKVSVLSEYVKHHVKEEEKPGSGIFAKARKAGVDLSALGERLQELKESLASQAESGSLERPRMRALGVEQGTFNRNREESTDMPRSYERDRDERGRFTDEDDRMSRGRPGGERDDENDGRYGRRGGYPERFGNDQGGGRDDRGGWQGYDEGRTRGPQGPWGERGSQGNYAGGRRGYQEEYSGGGYAGSGYPGSGRGYGGYGGFGDYRDDSRSRYGAGYGRSGTGGFERERDDYGRFSHDDDRGRGRWRNDEEDYARGGSPARYGTPQRDEQGRFMSNDENGHSREGRTGSRGSGGQGGGGWFGDSRGHSEAARRGWRDRD